MANERHLTGARKQFFGELNADLLTHHELHAAEVAHVDFGAVLARAHLQIIRDSGFELSRKSWAIQQSR